MIIIPCTLLSPYEQYTFCLPELKATKCGTNYSCIKVIQIPSPYGSNSRKANIVFIFLFFVPISMEFDINHHL